MGRAAFCLTLLALSCADPQPAASPLQDATLRYEGTVRLPTLADGEAFTVSIEVRAIPGKALRVDAFATPHPAQLAARFVRAAFTYSFLETADAYQIRAWMPVSPAGVRDYLPPFLNMRVARKSVPDPLLLPLEAPLRLVFDPIPVTAAFSPDLAGSSGERPWNDVTVEGTLARALPVRILTKRVEPSHISLRASLRSPDLVAITYDARTLSTRDLKGGIKIPDRLRLQWELHDATGARVVLASTLLKLAGEPELNAGLAVEDLERGFDPSTADTVLKKPIDYGPGYNRALALSKAALMMALGTRTAPTPTGRANFLSAFDGAPDASPSAAAAYAALSGPESLDGAFAKIIRAAEEKQPFTLPEASLALAASLKKEDAARVLHRGLGAETDPGWQSLFRAALVARDPATLDLHLGALDGHDAVRRFADSTILELADDEAAAAFKKIIAENLKDPATAIVAGRVAMSGSDEAEAIVEALSRLTEAPALAEALPTLHAAGEFVLDQNDADRSKAFAPAVKTFADKAATALPDDPRATLLQIDAAKLAAGDGNEFGSKLLDQIEKTSAAEGWDALLVTALAEACKAADRARLERCVVLLAAAMDQAPGSTGRITKDARTNPVLRLAREVNDWNSLFSALDAPGLRFKGWDFQFWEAVTAKGDPANFRDRAIEALDAGKLSPRALRVLIESRSFGGNLIDWKAILEKATAVDPKDVTLWTLRGRVAGLDAYTKALELSPTNVEAAVAVAESLPPADGAKLLEKLPLTDDARPFVKRIAKIFEGAGQADAAKKWKYLNGEE